MKILFIPNWNVKRLDTDDPATQPPDKVVAGVPYWFFRYFPQGTQVDILDRGGKSWFRWVEERIKFYIKQPVKAFMRRNRYDLVVSHGAQSGLVYELLASLARRKPRHIMIDVGGLNGSRINRTETPLIRWALRKGPHIVVHSSAQLSLYRDHYPALAGKARFIPFGADADFFQPKTDIKPQPTIVTFGYRKRDYITLRRAFASIDDHRGFNLFVVGPEELPPLDGERDVTHLPHVAINELQRIIASSALVVLPLPEYLYSYGQMSLLQSMLLGKMVIASRTTSTADYIDNAPGVVSVPVGNEQAMASAIVKALEMTPEQRAHMGALNRDYVSKHFNEKLMGEALAALAQEVTQSQSTKA